MTAFGSLRKAKIVRTAGKTEDVKKKHETGKTKKLKDQKA